jgi:predicted glutamine amidotransferase
MGDEHGRKVLAPCYTCGNPQRRPVFSLRGKPARASEGNADGFGAAYPHLKSKLGSFVRKHLIEEI